MSRMEVIAVDVPELGNRSYIVHDGDSAVVIDPSRRIDQLIKLAAGAGVTIQAVFETHIHNDYITGGLVLAEKLGVPYYVSAHDKPKFNHQPIDHEQAVEISSLKITALASPGHTPHHLSYLIEDDNGAAALFSGGSLLYGAVGRTDLIAASQTESLARKQYQTARFFMQRLSPETLLYPTHGFGSFCAASETEVTSVSTLHDQLTNNQVFLAKNEDSFVRELIDGLDDYPAYYAYMSPANFDGPAAPILKEPKELSAFDIRNALHTGPAIVDMRTRTAYAEKHFAGTYNIEHSKDLATYVGWLLAWDTPLILIADSANAVTAAQEQLSLIGRERLEGEGNTAKILGQDENTASYEVRTFAALAAAQNHDSITILDVRRKSEWKKKHIPEAIHIPLHQLEKRLQEIPRGTEVWVHCASGFRAAIAASILSRHGRNTVLIDDQFDNAVPAGLIPVSRQPFVEEVSSGSAQLLDVREDGEWQESHATNAVHIPLGELLGGQTAELDAAKPIYVYCAAGTRAGMAEHFLNGLGFDATNIGGLSDWQTAGGQISE